MSGKRIIAVNDLSGLGHSSLAAVLPVLSVMGCEVLPLPTAVLSSQTDGYSDYANIDLTPLWDDYLNHWQQVGIHADALYSGYLGSPQQVALVERAIDTCTAPQPLIVVDPVLGDGGVLYDTMDTQMVEAMKHLLCQADVITPNPTELRALCGLPLDMPLTRGDLLPLLKALSKNGPKAIVITSFAEDSEHLSTVCYERHNDAFFIHKDKRLPAHYPGTGDLFASILCGHVLAGLPLTEATSKAGRFVAQAIGHAMAIGRPAREGIPFEPLLGALLPS